MNSGAAAAVETTDVGRILEVGKMACCLCGVQITPNESYMCMSCLNNQVDITEGLNLNQEVLSCGKCGRWHIVGNQWKHMEDESPRLLAHLIKKLTLDKNRCRLLDAMFVWTEPHSKRLKIAVEIEKEVLDEKVRLSQRVVAEFVVKAKQCMECIREATDHSWGSCVQVRQRVAHKRGFDQLEALLIAKGLFNLMLDVQVTAGGFDLYFKSKNQGDKVIEVISSAMPVRKKESKKLVSHDSRSATAKMEYTTVLDVVPVNRDDLVLLNRTFTSGKPELFLCSKVSSNLHFTAPSTLQAAEVSAMKYYQNPFTALFTAKDLVRYLVLDITPIAGGGDGGGDNASVFSEAMSMTSGTTGAGAAGKYVLAEAEVLRDSDSSSIGGGEEIIHVMTHLGHILKPGDIALGYHLASSSHLEEETLAALPYDVPECLLVRKLDKAKESKEKGDKKSKKIKGGRGRRKKGKKGDDEGEDDELGGGGEGDAIREEEEEEEGEFPPATKEHNGDKE